MADATDVKPTDVKPESKVDDQDEPKPKTYSEEEFKVLIAERDKAKKKVREIEEKEQKALEAKALEEGKLKEVLEEKTKRLEALEKEAEGFREKEEKRRKALLEKLPEEDRKVFADADAEKLQYLVDKQGQVKGTKPESPSSSEGGKKWEDYTPVEISALAVTEPGKYQTLMAEMKKRRGLK